MRGLHTFPERLFFPEYPQAVVLILTHEWSMQKDIFFSIETSIFSLFHPFNLVVDFFAFPFSSCQPPRQKPEMHWKKTRCHTVHIPPKKNNHATVSLPNLDSLRAITFKEHFSGAPSPAQLVSMANGNLISSKRGQQA